MSLWGSIGSAVGGFVGNLWKSRSDNGGSGIASALGGIGGWLATKKGAKQSFEYNKQLMKYQQELNKQMTKWEKKYNKYYMKLQKNLEQQLQGSAYQYQNQLQQSQMNWEQQMSNTAHQREVSDLRQAGLNPILSANGGASTPSAGMGSIGSGNVGIADGGQSVGLGKAPELDYAQVIQNSISNAMQQRNLDIQEQAVKGTTNLQYAQAENEYKKGHNLDADTKLKQLTAVGKQIENENLPKRIKAEINEIISRTKLNYSSALAAEINAEANETKALSEKELNSAKAVIERAKGINYINGKLDEEDYEENWSFKVPGVAVSKGFKRGYKR